jgi:hypothetical protein
MNRPGRRSNDIDGAPSGPAQRGAEQQTRPKEGELLAVFRQRE